MATTSKYLRLSSTAFHSHQVKGEVCVNHDDFSRLVDCWCEYATFLNPSGCCLRTPKQLTQSGKSIDEVLFSRRFVLIISKHGSNSLSSGIKELS